MAEKAKRQGSDPGDRQEDIAVAAYDNAERRAFDSGGEVDDSLEAERQVDGRSSEKGPRGEAAAQQPDGGPASGASGVTDRPDFPDLNEAGIAHVEPDEVDSWAHRLDIPAEKLREAIHRVGPVIRDIKRFLGGASPS